MKTLHSLIAAVAVFAGLVIATGARAVEISAAEKTKIEALLTGLEKLENATFVRNGTDYDAKSAATFLRRKWQAHGQDVTTAADFITKLASISSTSGKPYTIRFKDGRTINAGEHLTGQLKKLEQDTPAKPDKAP